MQTRQASSFGQRGWREGHTFNVQQPRTAYTHTARWTPQTSAAVRGCSVHYVRGNETGVCACRPALRVRCCRTPAALLGGRPHGARPAMPAYSGLGCSRSRRAGNARALRPRCAIHSMRDPPGGRLSPPSLRHIAPPTLRTERKEKLTSVHTDNPRRAPSSNATLLLRPCSRCGQHTFSDARLASQ